MPDSGLRPRPVTLRQLLAAGALGESRVVAGDTGLDRIVEDVLVTDRCDSATSISPGLLVLLDATGLRPNSYALDVALRSVRDGGGAGLVAVNAVSATGIATRRLADRFGTVLVETEVPDMLAAAAAARELVMQPAVHQAAMMAGLLRGLARAGHSVRHAGARLGGPRAPVLTG